MQGGVARNRERGPMPEPRTDLLRALPQVEELMQAAPMKALEAIVPRSMLVDRARAAVDGQRQLILAGAVGTIDVEAILTDAVNGALATLRPSLRRVINATGVIIHTNLGRSVLAEPAVQAVVEAARGYSTLEYSIENMARGSRHDHVERLICALTGAEAAIAVNNNAAAVMMVLAEFAAGPRSRGVSRGELVEIGGSRSACPTSWRSRTRAWWRWAPRTRRTPPTTSAPSRRIRPCCSRCTPPTTA